MKAKTTVTILLALLTVSLVGLATTSKPAMAAPGIIQVSPGESIQAAINTANFGDTVLVAAGTYQENVVINQTITLVGSGYNDTFIEPTNEAKPAIDVKVNNANISKFTIQGGSSGVRIIGHNFINISNNIIKTNKYEGIDLESSLNNTIVGNIISLNGFEGIYLQFSNKTTINHNILSGNYDGVGLVSSSDNRISNNTIAYHSKLGGSGIYLDYYYDPFTTSDNTFDGNTLQNNTLGISITSSNSSLFYRNNFINNTRQCDTFESANLWNTTDGGNHWSDFHQRYPDSSELDATGLWNTPYLIDADTIPIQQDYLPLISPFNPPVDVGPPITADDYNGLWHTRDFYITLTATDDFSGAKETYYIINGPAQVSNVTVNGQPYITTEGSNNTLEYWSVDKVGNNETHHILTDIKLDKTAPSGSIQINSGDAYTTSQSVMLSLSATDSLSGVAQMRFSNDNSTWTQREPFSTPKAWNLTGSDGAKTVNVVYYDYAGNSKAYNDTIVLDKASPIVLITFPSSGEEVRSQTVMVEWFGVDIGLGIDHFEIVMDAGSPINVGIQQTYTFSGLNDGDHSVTVKAFDKINHENEASVGFVVNTSPLGGPGYLEEAAVIIVVAVAVVIVALVIRMRRKRPKGQGSGK